MTRTIERQTDERSPARTTAETWLTAFEEALGRGDVDAAVELFGAKCYSRGLIAVT